MDQYFVLIVVDLICRAVELEVLVDLTTEETLLALRRIVARHTSPLFVLSDNAKQFKLLNKVWSAQQFGPFEWRYVIEYASWQAGVYERLLGVVKQLLFRTFHGMTFRDSVFRTAMVEIVGMINDRPLTYMSEDSNDPPSHQMTSSGFITLCHRK